MMKGFVLTVLLVKYLAQNIFLHFKYETIPSLLYRFRFMNNEYS